MGRRQRREGRVDRLFRDVAPAPAPSVAPLRCAGCGAPVPLGDGDALPCAHCGAKVELPEAHRRIRDAERAQARDRAAAERLYAQLGTPPSALLRGWARAATWVGTALAGVAALLLWIGGLASLALLFLLELVLHALAPHLGIDLVDRLGGGGAYATFALVIAVAAVLPIALSSYLASFVALRRTLQAALAAKPPERPGFPSTCRECGAGLAVPSGALGVRCSYCRADNLVALPSSWVAEARTSQQRFHGDITEAARREAELRGEGRTELQMTAILCGIALPLAWLAGTAAVFIDNDMRLPAAWRKSLHGDERAMVARQEGSLFESPSLPVDTLAELAFTPYESDGKPDATWTRHYTVALRRGETLRLTSPDLPSTTAIELRNTTTFPGLAHDTALPWRPSRNGDYAATWRAPYTGLFLVDVALEGVHAGETLHLGWSAIDPDALQAKIASALPPSSVRLEFAQGTPVPSPEPPPEVQRLVETVAHGEPVHVATAATRPDVVALSGEDERVRIASLATGQVVRELRASQPPRAIAWSSDGALLATASAPLAIATWATPADLHAAGFRELLVGHTSPPVALAFLDGTHVLASADRDGYVKLWDALRGRELYTFLQRAVGVRTLAWSPDGTTLIAGCAGGGTFSWHAPSRDGWIAR